MKESDQSIQALNPSDNGHQFVCYADCCSGVPGGMHEKTFAAINKTVARLDPRPEFICFPGDEIKGLLADADQLREQWRYWHEVEMGWLDRSAVPIYHTTGNHTAYDPASIKVFRDVLAHLPQNGPADQKGLSYFVRKNELLMIFVNTLNEALGGEGWVETEWLEQTLQTHADAKYKFVFGHHPVFSVNGFSGAHQRDIEPDNGQHFWNVLVKHQVFAYFCSHIMAFDVQVHRGVLQILTGGAGTTPLMPADVEYNHCVQAAVDSNGLRYQVLDTAGNLREWLKWPIGLPAAPNWRPFSSSIPVEDRWHNDTDKTAQLIAWRIKGICASDTAGEPQTLLSGTAGTGPLAPIWIGLRGPENRLYVMIIPEPGRSPRFWQGPSIPYKTPFEIQLGFHSGMGPGGILWRWGESSPWSSFKGTTAWGIEKVMCPAVWLVGHDQFGADSRPFLGSTLDISFHSQQLHL